HRHGPPRHRTSGHGRGLGAAAGRSGAAGGERRSHPPDAGVDAVDAGAGHDGRKRLALGPGSPMIISRTPLRVSLVGGGSDLEAFYQDEPGAVVSTAIRKYIYITVNQKFDA